LIDFTLDQRSINRLAAAIAQSGVEAADVVAERAARLTAQWLDETYPEVLKTQGLVAKPKVGTVYLGTNAPRPDMVKLAEAFQARPEKTARGWVVHFEMRNDLNEQSKAKVRTVFMKGRSVRHDIKVKDSNWLTGWEHNGKQVFTKQVSHPGSQGRFDTLKLLRDRVYQRIRRAAV